MTVSFCDLPGRQARLCDRPQKNGLDRRTILLSGQCRDHPFVVCQVMSPFDHPVQLRTCCVLTPPEKGYGYMPPRAPQTMVETMILLWTNCGLSWPLGRHTSVSLLLCQRAVLVPGPCHAGSMVPMVTDGDFKVHTSKIRAHGPNAAPDSFKYRCESRL